MNSSRLVAAVSTVALTVSLAACSEQPTKPPEGSSPDSSKSSSTAPGGDKLALANNVSLTGAGATFPYPLYQKWFAEFNKKHPKVQINYQSVGSGAGVEQLIKGTVDFGASDVGMKEEEIKKVDKGIIMLPMTAGSIVMAYNLPGVDEIKLPRAVYVDILLGKIKSWDDPKIVAANPGVKLPKQAITVVYRSDGSGTTAVFTKHLSAISPDWKTAVGDGKSVKWPVGVGAKGNEGVTAQIQQTPGSIGYTEYGYAKQNKIAFATLENKAGKYPKPTEESASKSLASVKLPENLKASVTDPEGDDSYPIVTYTWLLVYKQYADADKAKALEAVIEYGLTEGQKFSAEIGYVPLPQSVVEKVGAAAQAISPEYKIEVGGGAASPAPKPSK
jgi:phosphate transport system substrate-binding protein